MMHCVEGFIVKDNFIDDETAICALKEAQQLGQHGKLQSAGMGRGQQHWSAEAARGDRIMWLNESKLQEDRDSCTPHLQKIMNKLRGLRQELASGSPDFQLVSQASVQLAHYPGEGARYVKHFDTNEHPGGGGYF